MVRNKRAVRKVMLCVMFARTEAPAEHVNDDQPSKNSPYAPGAAKGRKQCLVHVEFISVAYVCN